MSTKPLHNEKLLSQRFQAGDAEAFTELYWHYVKPLYYNILNMVKDEFTAEDLVQDVFAHLWTKRREIKIEGSFGDYLFMSSRNRVYNFFRKLEQDQQLYRQIKLTAGSRYSPIEDSLLAAEHAGLLRKALESLPPQRRRAFELCKIEGLSYQDASIKMGVSLSTVKDHMANARQGIRDYILRNRESAFLAILLGILHSR